MAINEVPGGEELATDVYCTTCLEKKNLDVDSVETAVREQRALADYLNGANCPFVFHRVDGDGYCLFRNLEDFAKQELGLEDLDSLCYKIIDSAVAATEATLRDLGEDAIDGAAFKALKQLQRAKTKDDLVTAIKRAWRKLEAEQIIRGFVHLFSGRMVVQVYRLSKKGEMISQSYPEEHAGAEHILSIFHWNSVLHFDRLLAK